MRTRLILKFVLVGILITAFAIPTAMAQTSYQYAMSSHVTTGGAASWLVNTYETISTNPNTVLGHGYLNTFNNNNPSGGPCYLYRLTDTNPDGGLTYSLNGNGFNNYLLSSGSYNDPSHDTVTVSGSASGLYVMSTSHYYYPKNYPGVVWYPPTSAVKAFSV